MSVQFTETYTTPGLQTFRLPVDLPLEQGGVLHRPVIAYHTYGTPGAPVVWVCHALTANSDVFDWWSGLFGEQDLFNPGEYYIVCANILGSCYGSEGPLSEDFLSGSSYFHQFPELSIRDLVAAHEALRQHLGVEKIHLLLGGSLGGQQAMEWAIQSPERFENLALIATNARHSAWGIAFNEAQRMAIEADGTWRLKHPSAGDAGMRAARATALLSYRNYAAYADTQSDPEPVIGEYRAASYQQYQGEKLSRRFNAFSYYTLSKTMDTHHVGRGRNSKEAALAGIQARTAVISISSDVLFPPAEQEFLAKHIRNATFHLIDSAYGHDGFLIETQKIGAILSSFLDTKT